MHKLFVYFHSVKRQRKTMKKSKSNHRVINILLFPLSRNGWPFTLAAVTFTLVQLATKHPHFTERYYAQALYPMIAASLSWISHHFAFSLWDISWILMIAAAVMLIILMIIRKIPFWRSLLRLLQSAAILYTIFYWCWGFNYFRQPMAQRMEWKPVELNDDRFLASFDTLITAANQSKCNISKADYAAIDKAVEASYRKNAKMLALHYPNGNRRPKTMLFSAFFAKAGISGYYGPLFSEVHLNANTLPGEYPFVLAHEKAHQFGITGEAEANFIAWFICSQSDDQRLQYSGNLNLLRYFLSDAFAAKDLKKFLQRFDKKALDDIVAQRSHWLALRNETIDKAQTAANDAYLKSNKIDDGVKNYNKVVALTIQWMENQKTK
jgi:hypothetical protein